MFFTHDHTIGTLPLSIENFVPHPNDTQRPQRPHPGSKLPKQAATKAIIPSTHQMPPRNLPTSNGPPRRLNGHLTPTPDKSRTRKSRIPQYGSVLLRLSHHSPISTVKPTCLTLASIVTIKKPPASKLRVFAYIHIILVTLSGPFRLISSWKAWN
ncbi:hypothetical protein B0T21DRAFT_361094 [Apiosordaria backusii]|uniref:Uncharacterized protein n=1 Tax=Apiosordaria backusii TaxID=314023 RepID=A0AA40EMZ9_9PEZI|nr:hypothetical protein B0T21DRAFT_361094 [Apiosordaria backusii]